MKESWQSDDCPDGIAEQFWQHVLDYETAPLTCHFNQLIEDGIELPAAQTMTDAELTAKLWEVIRGLAARRIFLSQTDHLNNRELYVELWTESLREVTADVVFDENSAGSIDIVSSGSDADIHLWLKHYADGETRQLWAKDFPEDDMPAHEAPPYDRDRHLPKARYGRDDQQ